MILLATRTGFRSITRDRNIWRDETRGLDGVNVTALVAREDVILAGTTDGIVRSDDRGKTWREASAGLTTRHVRWMAFHHDISDLEFAGTEPANILVSHDGAQSWRECSEIPGLRDQHRWMLPYSPEAGCVRGFAFHGERAYAAVEVGGILRSDDRGETWRLAEGSTGEPTLDAPMAPFAPADVHSVVAHPGSPEIVFAATHDGLYRSADGGATWVRVSIECYTRALWLDPPDPDHLIFGPATTRGWRGSISESRDGGATWRDASNGLNAPLVSGELVERFAQVGDELYAVLSNGGLIVANIASWEWREVLPESAGVNAVTAMQ